MVLCLGLVGSICPSGTVVVGAETLVAEPNWRHHIGTPSLLLDETFGAAELLAFDLDEGMVLLTMRLRDFCLLLMQAYRTTVPTCGCNSWQRSLASQANLAGLCCRRGL